MPIEIECYDVLFFASSCCGATTPSNKVYNIRMDDYSETSGYVADVDLGLGCVQPTQFAQVKKGDTLIDLGSGAGNDCFVARHETGSEGKVIRIDFTPIMIEKALGNAEKRETNDDKPKVTLTEFIFQIFVGQRADVVDFTKIIDGTILSWEDA